MEPIKRTTEAVFSTNFRETTTHFRRFFQHENGFGNSVYSVNKTVIEVCIDVNRKASCEKGSKYIPLLQFYDVSLVPLFIHNSILNYHIFSGENRTSEEWEQNGPSLCCFSEWKRWIEINDHLLWKRDFFFCE